MGMTVRWEAGKRFIYRVEVSTSSMVPRRTTGVPIHVETTLNQDLAFSVTNAASGGDGRVVSMELLAVQMETARDDGVTVFFDSDNKAYVMEDNPIAERLQKLVGLRMKFHLSGENKVTRVDGMKDLNDRMSGAAIRGVANGVVSRFFNQQFFRDIIEMGMMPPQPVTVGQTWSTSRQVNAGLWGTSAQLDVRYTFKGWQRRQGTNCARLDFAGKFTPSPQTLQGGPPGPPGSPPPGPPPTNAAGPSPGGPGSPGSTGGPSVKLFPNTNAVSTNGPARRPVMRNTPSNVEEGTVTGRSWYDPDLSLAVETIYDQTITTRSPSSNTKRVRGTNVVVTVGNNKTNALPGTNAMVVASNQSPPPPPTTTTSQWHTRIRLLEVEPLKN
jgi:hypothetical protein